MDDGSIGSCRVREPIDFARFAEFGGGIVFRGVAMEIRVGDGTGVTVGEAEVGAFVVSGRSIDSGGGRKISLLVFGEDDRVGNIAHVGALKARGAVRVHAIVEAVKEDRFGD